VSAGHAGDEHGKDAGHGHGHSPWIQHHYDDAQHQFDSGKLGIWLFLAQEVLFFSALFVAYILYRHHHPEIYGYAHKYLDVKFGAINTAVLIFSSLTAAWAVRAAQKRQKNLLVACLAATLLCALGFLAIKYIEYTHKVHESLLFGERFDPCITASGKPLLNRGNECPGHKGSVLWDSGKKAPALGCFPALAIDQKPLKAGVQADCTNVREVPMAPVMNAKNEHAVDPDSKALVYSADEKAATPIKKMCKPGEHAGEACWRTSHQPQVCRPGWFYTMRCTGGAGMAKMPGELAAAKAAAKSAAEALKAAGTNKDAVKKAEEAVAAAEKKLAEATTMSRIAESCSEPEKFSVSFAFPDQSECKDGVGKRSKLMLRIRKEELELRCPGPDNDNKKKCLAEHDKDPDLTTYTIAECLRSEQVGIVAEHHDHTVRPANVVVLATCKAPAKEAAPDWFGDKKQTLTVGAKATTSDHAVDDGHGSHYDGPPPEHTGMFFTIYFAMTGLHGIHVLVGVFVFIWLLIRASKGHFSPEYFGPVDWAALYWHIVDLIWIFLFPLMYLIH
jgi:heme/copper-type cytochrome/quinol oxidase subunit 3